MSDFLDRVLELCYHSSRLFHPLTDEDWALVDRVKQLAEHFCERGFHQLVSIGVGRNKGRKYRGLQRDSKLGHHSRCAEWDAIDKASFRHDRLRLIATARRGPGGETKLAMPCASCKENILQFCGAEAEVIIPWGSELIKVPADILNFLAYAPRERVQQSDFQTSMVVGDAKNLGPLAPLDPRDLEWIQAVRDDLEVSFEPIDKRYKPKD